MINYNFIILGIIFIPLLCAFAIFFIDKNSEQKTINSLNVALLSVGTTLLFSLFLTFSYKGNIFISDILGANSKIPFGFDNLALCFISLLNAIIFIALIAIRNRKLSFAKESIGLVLLLNSCLVLCILVLDVLYFYIFLSISMFMVFMIVLIRNRHQQRLNIHRSLILHLIFLTIAIIAITYIENKFSGTDITVFKANKISPIKSDFIFFALSLPLLCGMMIFPFHSWYTVINSLFTNTYRIIIVSISVVATFGFLRWVALICPNSFEKYSIFMQIIGVISFIFAASCMNFGHHLMKKANYLAIASSSYVLISIFANMKNTTTVLMVVVSYCFETILFLEMISVIKNRIKTLNINGISGLKTNIPMLNFFFIPLLLSLTNIPLSIGFIGRFLTLQSMLNEKPIILLFAIFGHILIATSLISLYRKIFLGKEIKKDTIFTLNINEIVIFSLSLIIIYVFGIFPYLLIEKMGI